MIKLKNIFDLPINGDDVAKYYYLDCSEPDEDEAIAHAINCHDELVDALDKMAAMHRKTYGLDGAYDAELLAAESALKKARGEK